MIPGLSTRISVRKCVSTDSYSVFNVLSRINPVSLLKGLKSKPSSTLGSPSSHYTLNSCKLYSSFSHKLDTSFSNVVFSFKHFWFSPNYFGSFLKLSIKSSLAGGLSHFRAISTLKRRKFKIKKHKKKKRKKRMSRMNVIPSRAASAFKPSFRSPAKVRRIVKERRARNKGNRTLRIPRQR